MKILVASVMAALLCVLVSNTLAMTIQQLRNMSKMPRQICTQRTGVSKDVVDQMHAGEFPEDPKLKCYMSCCMGMMQVMKNGKYNAEAAIQQADKLLPDDYKDPVKAVIQICKDKGTSGDACEDAFEIVKCNYMENKDVFLFP